MSAKDGAENIEEDAKKVEKIPEKVAAAEITPENNIAIAPDKDGLPSFKIVEELSSTLAVSLPVTLHERFLHVKQIVKDAIAAHHTFMVYGRAKIIRECMLKRGWIEKIYRRNSNGEQERHQYQLFMQAYRRSRFRNFSADQQQQHQQQSSPQPLIPMQPQQNIGVDSSSVVLLSGIGELKDEQSQRLLMSKMLANHTVDFLWNSGSDLHGCPSQENKITIFNRYSKAAFTSKIGLCSNVRQMHWYYEPGIANTLFPRCYNICQPDHLHAFIEDFRLTACLSLLKWFIEKTDNEGENSIISPTGMVPVKALDFAIRRCSDFIGAQAHEDIDKDLERVWSHQWDQFICWYYKIVRNEAVFLCTNTPMQKYIQAAKHILKRMRKYWHQLDMDGVFNIWILKPGNRSRGRGIVLMNKIEDVMAKINPANKSDSRYVVQKYIERPLLIYNTKFDIRQWFIVTCSQPLTLWMYRESYLRFCSQEFRLTDLHESVHLSNNAVQCKYKNTPDRDPALPADNMWDATTFKQFLASQGHGDVWNELIYPGMRQGLVGSLLASQEAMDRRKNSFELYGADFMVMEDFSVWLIEINSHPDMSYTTSVTSKLCKQVMEDTIKVIVDFREDKNANTGLFELAYKQRMPSCQPYLGTALSVQGTKIQTSDKKLAASADGRFIPKLPLGYSTRKKSTANSYIGPVIVDLIEELEIQLDRELHTYSKLECTNESNYPSPNVSSSRNSLALTPVQIIDSSTPSVNPENSIVTSPNIQSPYRNGPQTSLKSGQIRHSSRKTTSKAKKIVKDVSKKSDSSSARQSTAVQLEKKNRRVQPRNDGESRSTKNKTQTEEKLMGKVMRNAVNRYKKYGSVPLDVPPLPSLMVPGKSNNRGFTRAFLNNNKIRNHLNSQKIRDKSPEKKTDMYAIGFGFNK
ncbi:hypothetical protein PV326_013155 [Microctonus aethiopoides]|nr:hypothetical protein PV326_013155 [Microctonus aethiopoides]